VKPGLVDLEKLRVALRQMSRGHLLMIADRAIERVAHEVLDELMGDMLHVPLLEQGELREAPLLDQVRKFSDASLRGDYHESFDVNSKNCMDHSKGTDAFIAAFDRLIARCLGEAAEGSHAVAREGFELLFALLRRIDEDPDRIVFFADEAGSWQILVDWRTVLPTYFQCLAQAMSGENFAREVDRTILDFCHYDRPRLLDAARSVANTEQKAALRGLPTRNRRP
jgi:hypothetical protein